MTAAEVGCHNEKGESVREILRKIAREQARRVMNESVRICLLYIMFHSSPIHALAWESMLCACKSVCAHVWVCICVRERESEREGESKGKSKTVSKGSLIRKLGRNSPTFFPGVKDFLLLWLIFPSH